jgi:CheY-like chemotaxis protein
VNLLFVDDDPAMRLVMEHALAGCGFSLRTAAGAADAERACVAQRPDVLLLDVQLGAEDGIALGERLLGSAPPPAPRLLFLTGRVTPELRARMHRLNPVAVLEKPFDPVTFGTRLRTLLAGR